MTDPGVDAVNHWVGYIPPPPPPPKNTRPTWPALILVGVAAAVFSGGLVYAAHTSTGTVPPAGPASSCLDALDAAEDVFGYAADALRNLQAMTNADTYAELDALTDQGDGLVLDIGIARSQYDNDAASCRGGG